MLLRPIISSSSLVFFYYFIFHLLRVVISSHSIVAFVFICIHHLNHRIIVDFLLRKFSLLNYCLLSLHPSLVSGYMSGDREVSSEQSSSVLGGASYDEFYLSGHNPMKDLSWLLEREPFAHSLAEEEDEKDGVEYDEEDDGEERENHGEGDGAVGKVEGNGYRPFIP